MKSKLQNKKSINEVWQIILSIKDAFPKARDFSEIKMRFSDPLKLNNINEVLQIILSIKGAFPKARNLSEIKMRFSDPLKLNNEKFKQQKKNFFTPF